jgi:hypothetical protein
MLVDQELLLVPHKFKLLLAYLDSHKMDQIVLDVLMEFNHVMLVKHLHVSLDLSHHQLESANVL